MLSDQDFDKMVEGNDVIAPGILQSWFGDNEFRLDMLASAIAMGYVDSQPIGKLSEKDFLLTGEALCSGVVTKCSHSNNKSAYMNMTKTSLKILSLQVDGSMFRLWLKRFRKHPKNAPVISHKLTEFDIIQECSNALYPSGRDGDFVYGVESDRIFDWLISNVNGVGLRDGRIVTRLIFAINPAKNPHKKTSFKYKK